jgi:RHS repeat-associated protein
MGFGHVNALGSETQDTEYNGAVTRDALFYPWGQFWVARGLFASFPDVDSETIGFDVGRARNYNYTQGRWMTPDPLGGDITNPQSLNRYSYVMNNPFSNIDPTGQACYGIMRALGGGCDAFMDNGVNFGWNWNEFDLMNIPIWGPWDWGPEGRTQYVVGTGFDAFGGGGLAILPLAGLVPMLDTLVPQIKPWQQNPCTQSVLQAVNNQFGTNLTEANVTSEFQFSTGAPPGQGTLNVNFSVPAAAQPTGVSPGRYPLNWWTYVIGYGSTLHIPAGPGGLDSSSTLFFSDSQFTAHLDSAFPYNPIGALLHWLEDVLGIGGHKQCP